MRTLGLEPKFNYSQSIKDKQVTINTNQSECGNECSTQNNGIKDISDGKLNTDLKQVDKFQIYIPEDATANTANTPPPQNNQNQKSIVNDSLSKNLKAVIALWDKIPASIQDAILSIIKPYQNNKIEANDDSTNPEKR